MNLKRPGLRELHHELSRRDLLRLAGVGLSGLGLVAIAGCGDGDTPRSPTSTPGAVVDPPPETTTIRLGKGGATCTAPLYLAEQFLPAEGFTNVQYIDETPFDTQQGLAAGEMDIHLIIADELIAGADAGNPLVILAGVHNSCFELFGNERVQSLRDLKGKRIWVLGADATRQPYGLDASHRPYGSVETLLAYVGIDRSKVEFIELSVGDGLTQMEAGTIDAVAVGPPLSTLLHANHLGHVVLNGMTDAPWSQYFCCMVAGNRDFVEKHPAATKRALRAILKAADMCAKEPQRAAHYVVDRGFTPFTYDQALDAIAGLSYTAWRDFNPEDTMRFYALRLKEAGLVKSTPDELIARATDWRYLEQIKRELAV